MFPTFLSGDSDEAARNLLGCVLVREIDGRIIKAKIASAGDFYFCNVFKLKCTSFRQ